MINATSSAASETGPQGGKIAAQAEHLASLFWESALGGMMSSVFSSSSLGTGAETYGGIALHAVASSGLFNKTDSSLTRQIVAQLTKSSGAHQAASARLDGQMAALSRNTSFLSSLEGLRSAGAGAAGVAPTGAATGSSGSAVPTLGEAVAYAQSIWASLKRAATTLQVPSLALLAQSALETGWGASTPGNNLFGVKAVAGQPATVSTTAEFQNGLLVPQTAAFAAYPSADQSIQHYVQLIESRYTAAVGSPSVAQYATSLQAGGYATDPNYAQKITNIANSPLMTQVLGMLGVSGAAP
jgi:flagellar protein FlgJ